MLLLETLPPGDPSGGVVYLRIVLSPEQASRLWLFLNRSVLQGRVVSTLPNPQAGGPPLVGCPRLLIQFIRSYPPYRRPFLYPQPEDAPCRGDRDPLHGRHDTIPVKSESANVSFYTNNSKISNLGLWHSCRKWAVCRFKNMCSSFSALSLRHILSCSNFSSPAKDISVTSSMPCYPLHPLTIHTY